MWTNLLKPISALLLSDMLLLLRRTSLAFSSLKWLGERQLSEAYARGELVTPSTQHVKQIELLGTKAVWAMRVHKLIKEAKRNEGISLHQRVLDITSNPEFKAEYDSLDEAHKTAADEILGMFQYGVGC